MGDSNAREDFEAVRSLAMPFFWRHSNMDRFLRDIFLPEWKILPYNSKLLPILAIKNMPEEHRNKAQDVAFIEQMSHVWYEWRGKQRFWQG